jgi:beta-D-xylosidase 4
LLKNENEALPLSASDIKTAAVIGPNANLSKSIALYYGGNPCFNEYWNAVDAVQSVIPHTTVEQGLPSVTSTDQSGFPAAIAAAKAADLVVLAIGQDGSIEHEGKDRTTIAIQDGQLALIEAITQAVDKPVIVLILTAGAVDVTPLLNNSKVGAILDVGQPSVTILGVADLLFGKVSPSGRMVQTTYPANFVNEVSMFDMGMRPGPSVWPPFTNPGRT